MLGTTRKFEKAHIQDMQALRTADIYAQFLRIAVAVAKHNSLFRARYPPTDPLYCKVEKAISGVFWDMPLQLHAFWDAVEKKCSWEEHQAFARDLEIAVVEARRLAERPRRGRNGEIKWKRSVPLAHFALHDEIEASANAFFTSVYSHCEKERVHLSNHERKFWDRCRRLRLAVSRAKRDRDDIYTLMLCLQTRLPHEMCRTVVLMML